MFGSVPLGSHWPPVHFPLEQSLAWVHDEPGSEPLTEPPEAPPTDDAPPPPPGASPWHTPAVQT